MSAKKGLLVVKRLGRPAFLLAASVLAIHLVVAFTGPIWMPYPYDKLVVAPPLSPPSLEHLFGTDQLGRDVFSRVVYGTRIVLLLSISSTALGVFAGGSVGMLVGYLGGGIDTSVMRLVDLLLSIPPIVLALLVLSGLGSSPFLLILTVAFVWSPRACRVARARVLEVVTEEFVTAAKLRGESSWRIVASELLPNVLSTLLVEFAIRCSFAVTMVGSLGFLGFGVRPPTPEWGVMVSESRGFIATASWTVLFPILAIASLTVAINLFTDGFASALGFTRTRGFTK
jgi:peptide/nickel transport system permease protein